MNKNDLHEWQSARDNAGNSFRYSIDERAGGHVPDVFAYVGRDELSNPPHDVVGLKQHLMPCGVTPLVCVEPDGGKLVNDAVITAMQAQANQYGKPILCVRYEPVQVLFVVEPAKTKGGNACEMN